MAGGEVQQEEFCVVIENSDRLAPTRLDIPEFKAKECCFQLPALAVSALHADADDEFKNDKHSVVWAYDTFIVSVVLQLEKHENGDWQYLADLDDLTYGMPYPFAGIVKTDVDNNILLYYVGFEIDWQKVLDQEGEGSYRIKTVETDAVANVTNQYSFEFCLKKYTQFRADRTTRATWYHKSIVGDKVNDALTFDYIPLAQAVGGNGWFNQLRLPDSFFGANKSRYERDYVRYSNGQQVWIQDEQIEEYELYTGQYFAELHNYIKTDILQADRILITDYNKNNPNLLQNKAVNPTGNYEPDWKYNVRKAFATITFEQEFQNRKKLRC